MSSRAAFFSSSLFLCVRRRRQSRGGVHGGGRRDSHCGRELLLLFTTSTSPCFSSNPRPLKTSRRPPLIMTRLSNPIAVAQTQGSALNPLVSDCFFRVKWLCPPCHSRGHRRRRPGCLELPRREPSAGPG